MKTKQKPITPESEKADWQKPEPYCEAKTDPDFASIYAADEGIDPDAVAHGLTRDEVATWLKKQSVAPEDCPLIVSRAFGESLRAIADQCGKTHPWVAKRLKENSGLLDTIRNALKRGEPLPAVNSPQVQRLYQTRTKPLHRLARMAREWVKPGSDEMKNTARYDVLHNPGASKAAQFAPLSPAYFRLHKPNAEDIVAMIRENPERLLDPKMKRLLEALVDLLEAAGMGDTKRRVGCVVPCGKRQVVAGAARQALKDLIPNRRQYDFPSMTLARVVGMFRARVCYLQYKYQATLGQPRCRRLAQMRKIFPQEFRGLTDGELQSIVTGTDSLTPAIRLAEKATEIHADSFKRAHRQVPPERFEHWC